MNRRRSIAEINVVPYVDVMLVLLVIFMITAPIINQGVEVDLPTASAKPLPKDTPLPIIVSVNKDANYF
jgi:biopolymer transport protein TolR